jgi:hypothetical protein
MVAENGESKGIRPECASSLVQKGR